MVRRPATPAEVADFERWVDSYFDAARRPPLGPAESAGVLLAVAEDELRMRTMTVALEQNALLALAAAFDDSKYAVKQALAGIGMWLSLGRIPGEPEFNAAYTASSKFLRLCDTYQGAVTAFSSYRDGRATAELSPNGKTLYLTPTDNDDQAHVLQLIDAAHSHELAPIHYLIAWVRIHESTPEVVRTVVSRTRAEGSRIHYEWDSALARTLHGAMSFGASYIPDEWRYRACHGHEIRAVLEALRTVCVYHILSVHFGAGVHGTPGMGVDSLLLAISRGDLARRVVALSAVAEPTVETILGLLTYGNGVRTPDPALQPLIPVDADHVAVPCFLVASSRVERNLLALQARRDRAEFDAQSDAFEGRMLDELRPILSSMVYRERYTIPGDRGAGDVDLLVVSPADRFVLVCELRWCIPPGETREVHNRMEAVENKSEQLERKLAACDASLQRILSDLRVPSDGHWELGGLVVLDGFSSAPYNGVTVVTLDLLIRSLGSHSSLRGVYAALAGGEYTPRRGEHYRLTSFNLRFGDLCVVWPGIELLPGALEVGPQRRS